MRPKAIILLSASLLALAPLVSSLPRYGNLVYPLSPRTLADTIKNFDPGAPPIKINFVGDVMMARGYEQTGGVIPTKGVNALFKPTRPFLGDFADITVANLECPLTDKGTPHPTKSIVFRGSPANVSGLVYAGIDIVTIANNHILDYGLDGLKQTQDVLKNNNIVFSGAGANADEAYKPAFYTKSGVRIAFVAESDVNGRANNAQPFLDAGPTTPGFANLTSSDLAKQIDSVRNKADLVVVEMHSGVEWVNAPRLTDIQIRQFAIDHGADLVICHHPHMLQGFQVYKGKLIAHSLGNFTFDIYFPETMTTAILNADIDQTGFNNFSITPVFIDDYIPLRATGDLGLHILNYIARLSKDLGTYLVVDSETVTAAIVVDTLRLRPNAVSQTNQVAMLKQGSDWVSSSIRLARTGSIASIATITPSGSYQYRLGRDVIWFGNFENEGCSLFDMNDNDEGYDSVAAHTGHRSLRQKRAAYTGVITTGLEQRFKCDSIPAKYSFYGWMKTSNAKNAGIKVKYFNARTLGNETGSSDIGKQISGTTDWTFYEKEFVPTNDSACLDLLLTSDSPTSGTGTTWFDDVGIIAWSDWKTFDSSKVMSSPNDFYWMQIKAGTKTDSASVTYTETRYAEASVSVRKKQAAGPATLKLLQNYSNPINPSTKVSFTLANQAYVTLNVYNILGKKVAHLVDRVETAGSHTMIWNPGMRAKGVYFYRLQTGASVYSEKSILLRK